MSTIIPPHKAYPSAVSDDEWAFVAPYLTLLALDALQRQHGLRAVFNALRYLAHTGAAWRYVPGDFPPWAAVYQQARRWIAAGCFEAIVHDLLVLKARQPQPSAAILDARVRQSTPERGARAGSSGARRRTGSQVHSAVDTLGSLLALAVTPASDDERTQVATLAAEVQAVTGERVELAYVDQGATGDEVAAVAAAQGIRLEVIKLPEAKRGVVLLPKRWIVERRFAWTARFRRLARDDERLPSVLAGLHVLAFACLMLHQLIHLYSSS